MNGVNTMADTFRRSVRLRGIIGLMLFSVVGLFLTAGSAIGAQAANQLQSVKMEAGAATPTVLIQTAEAVGYRYTVYDSFDPVRVVIDFPGMSAGAVPEVIPAGPAPLKELKVARFDLSSGSLTRVEIVLAANADYQVVLDGKNFRVVFPSIAVAAAAPKQEQPKPVTASAPPSAPTAPATPAVVVQDATVIQDVTVTPGRVLFAANGTVGRYEQFTLGNPPRLVVDLYGLRPGFKQRTFNVSGGMKQVRVGVYADKVRFVFDADGKALPEHAVDKQNGGLAVAWGKGLQGAAPAVAVVPATPTATAAEAPEKIVKKTAPTGQQVTVEGLDFVNRDGRSYVVAALSASANVSQPVQDGNLVRFEIKNAKISRTLRRSIDASAFPSAVSTVTPYSVTDDGKPAVRIAVELKGKVPFTLVDEGEIVKLVIEDGAYAEAAPPEVSRKEVVAGAAPAAAGSGAGETEKVAEPQRPQYTGQKISLVFDNADIRSILQLIGDVSGLNILASNDVKGDITLRLIDVPWDQALDLVLDTANLGKLQEGNVVRIMPIDKMREREMASLKVRKEEVDEGVLETKAFSLSYSKVDDAKKFLEDLKSKRGSIISDARNKQLIVKDVPSVLEQMTEMIKRVDRPERQVMIEARIVEANTNFSRDLGVKWGSQYRDGSDPANLNGDISSANLGLGGSFIIPPPTSGVGAAGAALGMTFGALDGNLNIDMRLSALESAGHGKIISTPRVTTLNGEKALISQGTKIPYTTVSDQGTETSFENAELKLEVTPEINPDGSVILDIKASNSAVGSIVPTGTGNAISIDEKKAETKVLVRDGQTTVIGGVFVEDERDADTGVPWLKDIPFLGHLFKSTLKTKDRRELLIFITPRILES